MTLSNQYIKPRAKISISGEIPTKKEFIKISKTWNDNQEIFFRKMIHQGGSFTLKGKNYKVLRTTGIEINKKDEPLDPPTPLLMLIQSFK
tara:strand:+ start:989 stop:1258 length:270 start_codon:yes stop_codon:yes gene_type:complete